MGSNSIFLLFLFIEKNKGSRYYYSRIWKWIDAKCWRFNDGTTCPK